MTDDDPDRRSDDGTVTARPRRAVLLGAGSALTIGLAGCSGGDDGGDEDGGDGSDGGGGGGSGGGDGSSTEGGSTGGDDESSGDDGGEPTQESMGEVASNAIDELAVVGWSSSARGDIFQVTATVENGGDETTALDAYTWGLRMYGESGEEIRSGASISAITVGDNDEVASGETGEALVEARPDDASAVASYELFLSCEGSYASGAYCPE